MNLHPSRQTLMDRGQRLRPCFNTFYNIGQRMAAELKPVRTASEAAANMGMTKRRFETVCYVALGKLVFGICESIRELESPRLKIKNAKLPRVSKETLRKYSLQEAPVASQIDFSKIARDAA